MDDKKKFKTEKKKKETWLREVLQWWVLGGWEEEQKPVKAEDGAEKAEGGTSSGRPPSTWMWQQVSGDSRQQDQVCLWLKIGKVYVMASPEVEGFLGDTTCASISWNKSDSWEKNKTLNDREELVIKVQEAQHSRKGSMAAQCRGSQGVITLATHLVTTPWLINPHALFCQTKCLKHLSSSNCPGLKLCHVPTVYQIKISEVCHWKQKKEVLFQRGEIKYSKKRMIFLHCGKSSQCLLFLETLMSIDEIVCGLLRTCNFE